VRLEAERALEDFLAALSAERNASRHTLDAYRRDVRDFLRVLGVRRVGLDAARADDVLAWIERQRRAGRKPATIARRLAALRGLYAHLIRESLVARDPTEHVEQPRRVRPLPRTLSREAVTALVEAPDVTTPRGLRDRALLELLYASGLRASEALGLHLGDVNRSAGYVQCTGKGRKERLVPVGAEALAWLDRYLDGARPRLAGARGPSPHLFLGPRGRPLTRQSLWRSCSAPRAVPGCASGCRPTRCVTASPATCWRGGPTCARCRRCSATRTSRRPRSTRTCRRRRSAGCTTASIPGPNLAVHCLDLSPARCYLV
jgi:integrase/recombinase XerD